MITNLSKPDRPSEIRIFVAIELPKDVQVRVAAWHAGFGEAAGAAKWVRPELLHVTLRFLGEIAPDRLSAVVAAVHGAAAGAEPFTLCVGRLGAFPNERNPRVLWVGLEGGAGLVALTNLHAALESQLVHHDFGRDDRPFSPHITVARVRERAGAEGRRALGSVLSDLMRDEAAPEQSFKVQALTVMRSDLGSGGPRYTPLASVPLGETQSTVPIAHA